MKQKPGTTLQTIFILTIFTIAVLTGCGGGGSGGGGVGGGGGTTTDGTSTTTDNDTDVPTPDNPELTGYQVIDTNQTKFYNNTVQISQPGAGQAFYGQDAQFSGTQPGYLLDPSGLTVYDNNTGLTWTQSADLNGDGTINVSDKLTYSEAASYPSTLNANNYGGYSDWRLPTIKQLYSLILFSGTDASNYAGNDASVLTPFIDTNYFGFGYGDQSAGERIIDSQWASSTLSLSNSEVFGQLMYGVNFADGRIKGYPSDGKGFYVLFVRGNSNYGTNSFTNNGDGTVTASATGLMWSQDDSGVGLNWEEALDWVAQRNANLYLGYSDWRLPNVKDLQSIVDYNRSPDATGSAAIDPVFNCTGIINEKGAADFPYFWSSTTHVSYPDGGPTANYVVFGRGLGYMNGQWVDVHGPGCQRSELKTGNPADYPTGHGPQGDAVRIYNYVRLVRDVQ